MISRDTQQYSWERPTVSLDTFGQSVFTNTSLGTVDVAIYFASQVDLQNPLFTEVTHIGLTTRKDVLQKDLIDGQYEVIQANPAGRLNQLMLKQV